MREPIFNPGGLAVLISIIILCLIPIFGPDVYNALYSVMGRGATVLVAAIWLWFVWYGWSEEDTDETRDAFIGLRQRWRRFSGSGQQILPPEIGPDERPDELPASAPPKDWLR